MYFRGNFGRFTLWLLGGRAKHVAQVRGSYSGPILVTVEHLNVHITVSLKFKEYHNRLLHFTGQVLHSNLDLRRSNWKKTYPILATLVQSLFDLLAWPWPILVEYEHVDIRICHRCICPSSMVNCGLTYYLNSKLAYLEIVSGFNG